MIPSDREWDAARAWDVVRAIARIGRPGSEREASAGDGRGSEGAPHVAMRDGEGGGSFLSADHGGQELEVVADGSWSAPGPVAPEAAALFDLYLPIAVRDTLVLGQVGQSLDGRVATESGHSHYVTGPEDLDRLHRVRALVDAVLIGAGTAAADDPRLTVRRVPGRHPARVVLDPRGRVPTDRALFTGDDAPTYWLRRDAPPGPLPAHVHFVAIPDGPDGRAAPGTVLELLRGLGLRRILIEGGGITVSGFLAAGALDRLHVTIAPLLIGAGRHGLELPPVQRLEQALRPLCRQFRLGQDVLFDLDLRVPPSEGTS
jgi:riboflavin-specific deaminase-like protein